MMAYVKAVKECPRCPDALSAPHAKRLMNVRDTSGIIALEAVVSLPIFILMMLALYSMILLFTAQTMIGHALTQSSISLSLETYSTEYFGAEWSRSSLFATDLKELLTIFGFNSSFVSDEPWYQTSGTGTANLQEVCKQRFCSYLAESETAADGVLKALGIADGVSGLHFEDSKLDGQDLTITLKYKIRLLFGVRAFGMDLFDFDATQSVCSRLWKK